MITIAQTLPQKHVQVKLYIFEETGPTDPENDLLPLTGFYNQGFMQTKIRRWKLHISETIILANSAIWAKY